MESSNTSAGKLTYADYEQLPGDGLRHEVIDGKHHVSPAPRLDHQTLLQRLQYQLYPQIELAKLGRLFAAPVDVVLSAHTIVQPDLIAVIELRRHILTGKNVQGSPDLVIEVLSPSTRHLDLGAKKDLYEQSRVCEYLVVDGEGRVLHQFLLVGDHYGPAIPCTARVELRAFVGVSVDLSAVWN